MKMILFDLDGTLLPMDLKEFEQIYFKSLCAAVPEIKPDILVKSIWAGTKAMFTNDGSRTNREAFGDVFYKSSGVDYFANEEHFLEYYKKDFQVCRTVCQITDLSRKIVHTLKEKGYRVAVATNPIFPSIATNSRLNWLGFKPEEFELVTTYEESNYAKPNPEYFREVCEKLNVEPQDCVMIGNDVVEDGCAAKLGIKVMLVTDNLVTHDCSPEGFWMGSLEDIRRWAESLETVVDGSER